VTRPQDGNGDFNAECDIGAVEIRLTDIDLSITKAASVATAFPDELVSFTLTVVNNGPAAAQAARVVDNISGIGLDVPQNWTCTPSAGASCSPTLSGSIDDVVQIPVGGSLVYELTAPVVPVTSMLPPYTITNTAQVIADPGLTETSPGDNSSSDSIQVLNPTIDLSISKTASVATAFPDELVSFTLTVVNDGPFAAQAARVVDNISGIGLGVPQNWTCTPSAGASCSPTLSGAIDDVVQIPVGGSLVYVLTAPVVPATTIAPPFTITNTAQVIIDPGFFELNPGDNSSSDSIQVLDPDIFDLQISKSDGLANANPDDEISYTITVTNAGTTVITGASVTDTLPAELQDASWSCVASEGGSCGSGSGDISDLATIPPEGTLVYTLTARIDSEFTGDLLNTATVAMPSGTTDQFPDNNTATDITEVVAMADVTVSKVAATAQALVGQPFEFTVTVSNLGPQPALSTVLDDNWSDGLELVSVLPLEFDCGIAAAPAASPNAAGGTKLPVKPKPVASAANSVQCNLGTLELGDSVILTMIFDVSGDNASLVTNTATVSSLFDDPNEGNNAATAMTEVIQVLSLEPLEPQLPAANVDVAYSQAFTVSGGAEPISIDIAGDMIDGLEWTVEGRTATLAGTPIRAGMHSFGFDVEDDLENPGPQQLMRTYQLQVATELIIDPETLPAATVGVPYNTLVESLNGVPPFTFNAETLPDGLSLNVDAIEGTPQTEGTFPVAIDAVDSQGNIGLRDYDFVVNPSGLAVGDQALPDGVVDTGYSTQLLAATTAGPLVWTGGSGLPPGLTMQSTGFIGGVPTQAGEFAFTATVTDASGSQSTGEFDITVGEEGLLAQETTFPPGAVGYPYTAPTGIDGGTAPYFCTATGAGLPPGLTLNGCNVGIDGIPQAPGTFRFNLNITDSSEPPNDLLLGGRIQIVQGLRIPDPEPPVITTPPQVTPVIPVGQPAPEGFPDEALQKLAFDAFGNRYMVGFSYNGSDYDIRVLKYSSRGMLIWDQSFDSGDHDYGYALAINPVDQSLYVGGFRLEGLQYKAVLLRYSLAGLLEYVAENPGGSQAKAYYDLAADERGVYAVGERFNGTNFDAIVALHGHDGTLMWETVRTASDTEAAYAIELNACEGCSPLVAGVTGVARSTSFVDTLDPVSGALNSLTTVAGMGILDIAPGNDGIVVGGSSASNWVIATIDMAGNELWRTTVNEGERFRSVATDRNGFVHAAGNTSGGADALVALLTPAGVLLGTQSYDTGVSEALHTLVIGPEGLITAAGQASDPATNNNTFLLLNFDTGKAFLNGPL
jgi:uncharacterized repeat protein (TIGR01451 family)